MRYNGLGRDLPPKVGFRLLPLTCGRRYTCVVYNIYCLVLQTGLESVCRMLGVSPAVQKYEANDEQCNSPDGKSELLNVVVHMRVTHTGPVTWFALLAGGVTHVGSLVCYRRVIKTFVYKQPLVLINHHKK